MCSMMHTIFCSVTGPAAIGSATTAASSNVTMLSRPTFHTTPGLPPTASSQSRSTFATHVTYVLLLSLLSVQCYAWTEYKFTCVCVRHTFCQLAYRSDPSTDFYS